MNRKAKKNFDKEQRRLDDYDPDEDTARMKNISGFIHLYSKRRVHRKTNTIIFMSNQIESRKNTRIFHSCCSFKKFSIFLFSFQTTSTLFIVFLLQLGNNNVLRHFTHLVLNRYIVFKSNC